MLQQFVFDLMPNICQYCEELEEKDVKYCTEMTNTCSHNMAIVSATFSIVVLRLTRMFQHSRSMNWGKMNFRFELKMLMNQEIIRTYAKLKSNWVCLDDLLQCSIKRKY
jgi:hypothetical protein